MSHRTSILCRRSLRTYSAAFISYLMLAGQVAPLAVGAAAPRRAPAAPATAPAPVSAAARPAAPLPFAAPIITATKADAFPDPNSNLKAEPGDTITYTVTISNTGDADATGVTFTDNVDTNTTLVGTSVNTQPITDPDTYAASGNIPISLAAPGVLNNDRDPDTGNNTGLTVTKVGANVGSLSAANVGVATDTTAAGRGAVKGSVNLAANGGFTYEPPPGFEGADTFAYEASDGTSTDTQTVTINVGGASGMVWFIQSGVASSNRGTFSQPFTTIAAFNTANGGTGAVPDPKNGDFIALRTGSGTYNEADGINLRAQQKLIGNGVAFNSSFTVAAADSSSAYTTFAGSAGTAPNITTTAGSGVDLSTDNTVRGLNVGNTSGFDINGGAVGAPIINAVNLTGTGGAINVATSGAFGANVTFGTFESGSSTAANVNLVGVTGTLGITSGGAGLAGSAAASPAVNVSGGSVSFTYPGDVSKTAGTAALVNVAGGHSGTLTFQTGTLNASAGTGLQFSDADGTYNFDGTTTLAGGDAGVDILSGSGGTFNFSASTSITSPTGTAFNVASSPGAPNVDYNGTITQNTSSQSSVNVDGTTGGTITFDGTVSGDTDHGGIDINNANGNVTFTSPLTLGTNVARMTNQAVTITGGTGTYSLGAVSIFTNAAQGLVATNADGTINATGVVNTTNAAAAGAAAVNIDGPPGLTTLNLSFTSVTASASNNGITVRDTNGTFTVTGTSTTDGSGGTISNITNRGASFISTGAVSLSNMTFTTVGTANGADPNVSNSGCGDLGPSATNSNTLCNAGVHLDTVTGVTLTNLDMNGGNQVGINGNSVTNFVLSNSNVLNFGDQTREDGLKFRNLLGTSSISGTTISGNEAVQVHVENISGTLTSLTVTDSTISTSAAPNGSHGILFDTHSTATGKLVVQGVAFSNLFSNCIDALSESATGGLDLVVNGNATGANNRNSFNGCGASGITLAQNGAAPVRFNIFNNGTLASPTFLGGTSSHAININQAGTATTSSVLQGSITGNFIGGAGATSSTVGGDGITVATVAPGTLTANVSNNRVRGTGANGIRVQMREESNTAQRLNLTLLSNDVLVSNDPNGFDGIHVVAGTLAGDAGTMCAEINGNDAGTIAAGNDFVVRSRFATTFQLRGYTGANNSNVLVQTHLDVSQANDPVGAGTDWFITNSVATGGGGFVNTPGGAQCPQPTLPSGPVFFDDTSSAGGADVQSAPAATTQAAPVVTKAPAGNVTSRPFVSFPRAKRDRGANFRYAAEGASVQLNAEPFAAQRQKTTTPRAPVQTDDPGGPNGAGGTVSVNIGTLRPGDSVTITFQVTIDNPYSGGPNVSNQGTVSGTNFSNVLTDDDPGTAAPNEPTLTPVNSNEININNAQVAEPASPNTVDMTFTVALKVPASGAITVNFATADQTATAGTCGNPGADYVSSSGQVAFAAGEQVKTINVPICSDAVADDGETLLVNLSGASGATLVDNQAVGTITANTAGTFLISELRTSGPGGTNDDFVELYNNSDSPLTVAASDISAGYGVFKMGADCTATPVLLGTIPNGTVIPARGHYLLVGSAYSLGNYGGTGAAAGNLTATSDIENDRNVGVFSTSNVAAISTTNRLDAVGFGTNVGFTCNLLREPSNLPAVSGSTLEYTFFRKQCAFVTGVGCTANGNPKDSNDNSADFLFADTLGSTISGVDQRLGAPGPENIGSPRRRDTSGVFATLLDSTKPSSAEPNRHRDFASNPGNNSTFGTLSIRRRVTNTTGAPVTRLRVRIVEMTTFPTPGGGQADMRAISSGSVSVMSINDAGTCSPAATPCTLTVEGTTLEQPPTQPSGGGYNSTLSAGTITLATPLNNNTAINLQFLLGIQQTGTFRFYIVVEALP